MKIKPILLIPGCAACLSKKKVVGKSTAGQTPVTIVDETDDWEFLSMYWWSRYDILFIFQAMNLMIALIRTEVVDLVKQHGTLHSR